jgi:hypothetical protein
MSIGTAAAALREFVKRQTATMWPSFWNALAFVELDRERPARVRPLQM